MVVEYECCGVVVEDEGCGVVVDMTMDGSWRTRVALLTASTTSSLAEVIRWPCGVPTP